MFRASNVLKLTNPKNYEHFSIDTFILYTLLILNFICKYFSNVAFVMQVKMPIFSMCCFFSLNIDTLTIKSSLIELKMLISLKYAINALKFQMSNLLTKCILITWSVFIFSQIENFVDFSFTYLRVNKS